MNYICHYDVASESEITTCNKIDLFYHKQWIQCISNVSKIGIFLQWNSLVTDTIYIFTVEYNRTVAKQGFLGNVVTEIFNIRFKVKYICQK